MPARSTRIPAATLRVEDDKLFVDYKATSAGSGYVAPSVMLEFGARSTGEPASPRNVVCDAAGLIDGIKFPTARSRVMHAEQTFWEKATAMHVFCLQGRLRGERDRATGLRYPVATQFGSGDLAISIYNGRNVRPEHPKREAGGKHI